MEFRRGVGYELENKPINLEQFKDPYVLNLFCDGSFNMQRMFGGYAVVAVVENKIVNYYSRASKANSSGFVEMKAIRLACSIANQFPHPYINIFSDSKYGVECIRRYIYMWKFDEREQAFVTRKGLAKNQSLIYEANMLFNTMCSRKLGVSIYFQPSHVDNGYKSIKQAASDFLEHNGLHCKVDLNFIRYISCYNNRADNEAKKAARDWYKRVTRTKCETCGDPITFMPQPVNWDPHNLLIHHAK